MPQGLIPSNEAPASRLKSYVPGILIFTFAALLRLIYLLEIKQTPAFYLLMGDGEIFDQWAQEIARGNWLGNEIFFQAPLYSYFLGAVYTFFGRDLFLVRVIQIGIGSLSCVLIMAAGRLFFSKKAGITAGLLLAIYPAAIFFDCQIQKAVVSFFFMALLVYLLGKRMNADRPPGHPLKPAFNKTHQRRLPTAGESSGSNTHLIPKIFSWAAVGGVLGLFVLVRENAMILMPVMLFWMGIYFRKEPRRKKIQWSLSLLLGTLFILFPVAARNKVVGNEFVLTTSNFGFNFYIGNNEKSTGTYTSLVRGRGDWRFEQQDAADLAQKSVGRALTPAEVSSYWTTQAMEIITTAPLEWGKLLFKKWALIWNAVDLSDTESIYAHYDWSRLLRSLGFFDFGWVVVLAAFGVCLTWPDRSRLWLLYLMVASYAAGVSLFFVFSRFRHPMSGILLLFAAAGLEQGIQLIRRKAMVPIFTGVVIATLTAAATRVHFVPKEDMAANTYYNLGVSHEHDGKRHQAFEYYQKSLALNPNHILAHNNIGILLFQEGQTHEAIRHFKEALRLKPDFPEPLHNLGLVFSSMGRLQESLDYFKKTVSLAPHYNPVVYYNIACIFGRMHQPEASIEWLGDAVRHGYENWDLIQSDPDLDSIRNHPGYQRLIHGR